MNGCTTFSAVELVGDGNGVVEASEINPDDLAVAVCRPLNDSDQNGTQPVERLWLSAQTFRDHLGTRRPDEEDAERYDAVIILANVPLPEDFEGTPASELSVEVTVSQIEQAKTRGCPRCQHDMQATFEDGGCTNCGFYFDQEHLTAERRAELDEIHNEYRSSDAT